MKRDMNEPARVEPLLTVGDRLSPLWAKVSKHLEARLHSLRCQNDGDKNTEETAKLRGRIAEIKALLDHGKEPIQPE